MNKLTFSLLIVLSILFQACDVSDTLAKGGLGQCQRPA